MVTGNMGRTQSLYRGCSSIHGPLLTASSSSQSSQHHSVSWAWARVSCPLDDMELCETHAYHQPATDPSHVMVNLGKPNLKAKPPKMCYTLSLGTNHTCLNFGEQFTLGWVWLHIFGISGGHWFTWSII